MGTILCMAKAFPPKARRRASSPGRSTPSRHTYRGVRVEHHGRPAPVGRAWNTRCLCLPREPRLAIRGSAVTQEHKERHSFKHWAVDAATTTVLYFCKSKRQRC